MALSFAPMLRRFEHALLRCSVLAAFLATSLALAQEAAPPPVSQGLSILGLTLTPEMLLGAAVTLVGGIFGGAKFLTVRRKKLVALAIYHAFHITEDAANETDGEDIFDKLKFGLSKANEYMLAHGWRPLKPGEQELAKLGFQSLHGEQLAQAKVIAKAQELASGASAEKAKAELDAALGNASP